MNILCLHNNTLTYQSGTVNAWTIIKKSNEITCRPAVYIYNSTDDLEYEVSIAAPNMVIFRAQLFVRRIHEEHENLLKVGQLTESVSPGF